QDQASGDIVAGLSRVRQPESGDSGHDKGPAPTVDPGAIDVQDLILRLFEEKTGYERELLDLDLDLEADLGIDTIKQAQIFASIRDKYGLAREEGVQLKDFPTLRKVIEYMTRRVEAAAAPTPATTEVSATDVLRTLASASSAASSEPDSQDTPIPDVSAPSVAQWTEIRRWSVVSRPTTPDPEQRRVQLSHGSLILLTDDGAGVAAAVRKRLAALGVKSLLLTEGERPTGQADFAVDFEDPVGIKQTIEEMRHRNGPIDGLIHLLPLKRQAPVEQMSLAEWRRTTARETKSLCTLAKALLSQPDSKDHPRIFAAATCLGGSFGFAASPDDPEVLAGPPSHGGVAGFVKALAKETSEFLFKVVDLDQEEALARPDATAGAILDEILSGNPAIEVGFRRGTRAVPQLCDRPLDLSRQPHIELNKHSVLLLFGGARGITGEIAKDLVDRFHCRLVLAGTTALPPDVAEIAKLSGENLARYRRQVLDELRTRDPHATVAKAEAEVQKRLRSVEIARTLNILRGRGADVRYEVCDVRDDARMAALFDDLSSRFGRLDGIVFASGIIEDKLLEDKTEESFSRVFDVKADGIFNLYQNLRAHPELKPAFVASFSSVAGRFGNRGQADYSAANELLAKFTYELGGVLADASCFVIDWTAWSEVGLPARSGLAAMMKEQGLDLLNPVQGAECFHNELLYGTGQEALYAGRLPGYTDEAVPIRLEPEGWQGDLQTGLAPMLQDVSEYQPGACLKARKTINLDTDRWLADHVIDGVPLLPGVLGIELMVEAARLLFPEFHFVGLDDLRILLAVKILKNRPVDLRITAQAHTAKQPYQRLVLVRIESDFIGPNGRQLGETRRHYEATVILSRVRPVSRTRVPSPIVGAAVNRELAERDIYGKGKLLPHGPAFSVLRAIRTMEDRSAVGWVAPINESAVCPALNGHRLSTLPLAREAGFQVAGLWAMLTPGIFSLPHGCRRLRNFGLPTEGTALLARSTNFTIREDSIECDVEIVGDDGLVYDRMEGYYAVPVAQLVGSEYGTA
ncbi:MAG: SDR family oxidoreductase, partial [Acidobacteria bacterium]